MMKHGRLLIDFAKSTCAYMRENRIPQSLHVLQENFYTHHRFLFFSSRAFLASFRYALSLEIRLRSFPEF